MTSQRKKYDERRNEILDTATRLFAEKGYEGATVQAVIDALGISKGAFYHYFSSKEEVLDGVIERLTGWILDETREMLEDRSLSAIEKLDRFGEISRRVKMAHMDSLGELMRVLYRDENVIMRHKINKRSEELARPVLEAIIAEGIEDGSFNVDDAHEATVALLHLGSKYGERTASLILDLKEHPENLELIIRRAGFLLKAYERILGAPEGSFQKVDRRFFSQVADRIGQGRVDEE